MSHDLARIIDGKKTAIFFLENLQEKLLKFKNDHKTIPSLAIIRIGHNPSSALYVKNKLKTFEDFGLNAQEHWFEESITEEDLRLKIESLNNDSTVHAILVQLPLPLHLNARDICNYIHPYKDVDGLTVQNQGLLMQGNFSGLFPCTPLGCVFMLKALFNDLSGKRILVIGRSLLVGRSLALLLLHENATVTVAHSKSHDLPLLIQESEIVISAVGRPCFIKGEWITKGTSVLDVGINKVVSPEGSSFFVGDIEFEEALKKVSYITPVPGGIGPMTVACLLYNTFKATQSLFNKDPIYYDFSLLKEVQFFN